MITYLIPLVFLIVFTVLFICSKPCFFALSLPARAVALTLIDKEVIFSLSLSDILGLGTVLASAIFLADNLSELKKIRGITYAIALFLIWSLFPIVFSDDPISKIREWAKLSSWLCYLPIGCLLYAKPKHLPKLKLSGVLALIVSITAVLTGQALGIGPTAYNLNLLYLGFYTSEAALSLPLVTGIAYLLLPSGNGNGFKSGISKIDWMIGSVAMVLVMLVMVRTGIIGTIVLFAIFLTLNSPKGISIATLLKTGSVMGVILALVVAYFVSNPEIYQARFQDVTRYQKSGKAGSLASGRVYLFEHYWAEFTSQSISKQVLGVDLENRRSQGSLTTFKTIYGTHNDVLQVLFFSGYVGFFFYAVIWWGIAIQTKALFRGVRDPYQAQVVAAGVASLTLYGIFSLHGMAYNVLPMQNLALLLGAAVGCRTQTTTPIEGGPGWIKRSP